MKRKEATALIDSYERQIEFISSNEVGRPDSLRRSVNTIAEHARIATSELLGDEIKLSNPDFDAIADDTHDDNGHPRPQPGRFVPGDNPNYLAKHGENIARLREALNKETANASA